jgi:hypothetical protein
MDVLISFFVITLCCAIFGWRKRHELAPMFRGWLRPVSTVLVQEQPLNVGTTGAQSGTNILSTDRQRAIALRYQRLIHRTLQAQNQKTTKLLDDLKTENQRLRQQLEEASAGQKNGIRIFLEKKEQGKTLSNSDVTLLLGRDKSAMLALIAKVDLDRKPVPPELANQTPLPDWVRAAEPM